jgi:hypothetical protein
LTEFALPLQRLPSGNYQVELIGANSKRTVTERLAFYVAG